METKNTPTLCPDCNKQDTECEKCQSYTRAINELMRMKQFWSEMSLDVESLCKSQNINLSKTLPKQA